MSLGLEELEAFPVDLETTSGHDEKKELTSEHKRVRDLIMSAGRGEWDEANQRLRAHTHFLKTLANDSANKIRGSFDTIATGSGGTSDRNCWMYPSSRGGWNVFRFGKGTAEHENWSKSANGWTTCVFNSQRKNAATDPQADIVREALERDEFFHSPDGLAYVTVKINEKPETLLIGEERYRHHLRLDYTERTGKIPKREWLTNSVEQLQAHALQRCPQHVVYLRVAQHDGAVFIDLGDSERNIVQVTADGWKIVQNPPVRFRRPTSMLPLPIPKNGGSLDELKQFVNIADADWPLFLGALVMMFHPTGPYPIVSFQGSQGAAKTCSARNVQALADPTVICGGSEAIGEEDLMILAQQRWLQSFDNLSALDTKTSDVFCRLTTGATHGRRKKYSDSDTSIWAAKRPVLITSISNVIIRSDALERALIFELPEIVDRKTETELNEAFAQARGRIFGCLLEGVSSALRNLATTQVEDKPRLADFAIWATAAEPGLKLEPGSIMAAYKTNRTDGVAMLLDDDLARSVIEIAKAGFCGTAVELAQRIGWETTGKAARSLAGQLRYLAPAIRTQGVSIQLGKRSHGKKLIEIGCPKGAPGAHEK